jgi:ATP-dependent Lon protease
MAKKDKIIQPVLPLRDIVVFPNMIVRLFVGRDKSVNALQKAMSEDKRRKFTISELYYFKLWWNMQKDDTKNLVKVI